METEREISLSRKELSLFFHTLAALLASEISLSICLKSISEEKTSKNLQELAKILNLQIESGLSLSRAMATHTLAFPPFFIKLIGIGESSGYLPILCQEIAEIIDSQIQLQKSVVKSLTYPCTVLSLASFLLPLPSLFQGASLSSYLSHNLYPLFLLGILFALSKTSLKANPTARSYLLDIGYSLPSPPIPFVGKLLQDFDSIRFLKVFSLCTKTGMQADYAAKLSIAALQSSLTRKKMEEIPNKIRQGHSPAQLLSSMKMLDWEVLSLLSTGEKTGKIEENYLLAARHIQKKSQARLDAALALLAPFCLLIAGGFIGVKIIGAYSKIFSGTL